MLSVPRVLVRLRPRFSREAGPSCCADVLSTDSVQFLGADSPNTVFVYDGVFDHRSSQEDVFAACLPIVEAFLESYNGTIMAYGQTGSGKTYSLFGNAEQPGVVPQVLTTLLHRIEQLRDEAPECSCTLNFSIVEIYCERIRDLLDQSKDNLAIGNDRDKGIILQDASEVRVTDAQQALKRVNSALNRRAVSATNMNERSSRSHCMVYLTLAKRCGDGRVQHSKLCLVDLAGSERQDKTGAEGVTLDEAKLINKSLSCLGNVVKALTEGNAHVPYRESKLTRALQDALGGNAKVVVLICCSPVMDSAAETLSSLRFGMRAKGLQNIAQVASMRGSGSSNINGLLASARQEAEKLRAENDRLQDQLFALSQQHAAVSAAADCNSTMSAAQPAMTTVDSCSEAALGKQTWGPLASQRSKGVVVLAVAGVLQLLVWLVYIQLESNIMSNMVACSK